MSVARCTPEIKACTAPQTWYRYYMAVAIKVESQGPHLGYVAVVLCPRTGRTVHRTAAFAFADTAQRAAHKWVNKR